MKFDVTAAMGKHDHRGDEQPADREQMATWQVAHPDVAVRLVGHRRRHRMLLGSTSQTLVYHATCPLLVTRQGTRIG